MARVFWADLTAQDGDDDDELHGAEVACVGKDGFEELVAAAKVVPPACDADCGGDASDGASWLSVRIQLAALERAVGCLAVRVGLLGEGEGLEVGSDFGFDPLGTCGWVPMCRAAHGWVVLCLAVGYPVVLFVEVPPRGGGYCVEEAPRCAAETEDAVRVHVRTQGQAVGVGRDLAAYGDPPGALREVIVGKARPAESDLKAIMDVDVGGCKVDQGAVMRVGFVVESPPRGDGACAEEAPCGAVTAGAALARVKVQGQAVGVVSEYGGVGRRVDDDQFVEVPPRGGGSCVEVAARGGDGGRGAGAKEDAG